MIWSLVFVVLLGAPVAVPSIGFEWDAPPGCPGARDVEATVRARAGIRGVRDPGDRLDVIARVRRTEDGDWALRIWLIDADGTHRRDLVHDDCRVLAEAAATIVAVFVEPKRGREESPSPTDASPKVDPAKVPTGRKRRGDRDPMLRGSRWPIGGDLRGLGGFEWGVLPGLGGGVGVGAGLDVGRARMELHGRGSFAPARPFEGGGSVAIATWSLGLRGGFVPRWGRVELPLLAGADGGVLVARGREINVARSGRAAWVAATLSPSVVVRPHPRVGLWLGVDGFVSLLRPRIVLDDGTLVHQPAMGGVRIHLGVGARFGARARSSVTEQPTSRRPTGATK